MPSSLIKTDVEGGEYDVMSGSENTIIQYIPSIILATHDFHLLRVKDKCLNFLFAKGYLLLLFSNPKFIHPWKTSESIYKPN